MAITKPSTQVISEVLQAIQEIQQGLEEQLVYDEVNQTFLDSQEKTDWDFLQDIILDLELKI